MMTRRALSEAEVTSLGLDQAAPSALESGLRGGAQGVSLGFADEIAGGLEALKAKLAGDATPFEELYARHRDESRAKYAEAQETNPNAYLAGELGGGAATALVPGLGAARGLAGAVKVGAAMGAAQGLGSSEADLLKGEVGQAATDAALGGVAGGAAGALGHAVSKGVGAIRNRAARGVATAVDDETARQAALVDKDIASKLGQYRSGVQSASRDLEVLGRESADLPGEVGARAREFISSPEGLAVREQVAGNKLATAPERISEMQQLRGAHAAAVEGRAGEIARRTEEGLADPIRKQFAPRLATLGHRLLPAALAGAGGVVGGPEGAAVGAGLGGVMALTQGRPGIILRHLVRSPASRKMLWEFVESAAGSQALGKFGGMLQQAARTGGVEGMLALHEALLSERPEYADEVGQLLLDVGGAQ
jgi:hypothetical protein